MSRRDRGVRRPLGARRSSPHERARGLAAERLAGPLSTADGAWLDAHLADCGTCRSVADAYAADHQALRAIRDPAPSPPRDLWARTAAAIEREAGGARAAGRSRPGRPLSSPRRPSLPTLSALSGIAVALVVVVATAVSGGLFAPAAPDGISSPSVALASDGVAPPSTAIEVGAGKVRWLGARGDGAFAYSVADIDVVCRHDQAPECEPLADRNAKPVSLAATPRFVYQSPVGDQAIVVGTDERGSDAVLVVVLPTPDPTPEGSTGPSTGPTVSDEVPSATDRPFVTPEDLASASVASPHASAPGSPIPEPSISTAVAIITDVTVVGQTAAFSPDGMWFAFSARPADGSAGPDIYVWHVGDPLARPLTSDHASVFASWIGGSLLGSRAIAAAGEDPGVVDDPGAGSSSGPEDPPPVEPMIEIPPPLDLPPSTGSNVSVLLVELVETLPETFLLDPSTGAEVALVDAGWRPAVDPTGVAVVRWDGTVGVAEDGLTASPASGSLVIHPFHGPLITDDPDASAATSPDASSSVPSSAPDAPGNASATPSASPSAAVAREFPPQVVADGPIGDFEARWDETGRWLAVWIADPSDLGLGRLSLLRFDGATGMVDRPVGAPRDVTALPGFSIAQGRLAWAIPPGADGEGSRIQIAAWAEDVVGAVESVPIEGAIVVQ